MLALMTSLFEAPDLDSLQHTRWKTLQRKASRGVHVVCKVLKAWNYP